LTFPSSLFLLSSDFCSIWSLHSFHDLANPVILLGQRLLGVQLIQKGRFVNSA
jgi:hypothetical protein